MDSRFRMAITLALLVPLLAACVRDDPVHTCRGPDLGLDGTWFGAMEDDLGTLFTLEWRICGSRIVKHRLSGTDYGISGRLEVEAPGVYQARLSDGSQARLLTDPGRRYATMVSDFFDFAVLERGALRLPRFRYTDLDGHWAGRQVRQEGSQVALVASRAVCFSGFCDTLDADGFGATLDLPALEPDFGLYWGEFTASDGSRGIAGALLSADRHYAGSYTCPTGYGGDPWECRFGVYRRD